MCAEISLTRVDVLCRQECVQQKSWGFECGFYPREQQNQVCQELEKLRYAEISIIVINI